jgi:hypothetical protein
MRCRDRDFVGFHDDPIDVWKMVVRGELGVNSAGSGRAAILDLTDVLSPVVLSTFEFNGYVRNYQFVGDRVFVCTTEEIRIVDISDPAQPVVLGVFPEGVWQITVNGAQAYARVSSYELVLINLTEETNPVELLRWRPPDHVSDLEWIGDYLYTARSEGGIDVFDLSLWWNPQRVGSLDSEYSGGRLFTDGQVAYVIGGDWFRAFDVSDVEHLVELGATQISYLGFPVLRGTRLYASTYDELRVFDISDSGALEQIGWYEVDRWPDGVALRGDVALVGASNGGAYVIDVSDPKPEPRTVSVPTSGRTTQVALRPGLLCVARGGEGVSLVDTSDPWDPAALATIGTPGVASDVALAGDLLCVADTAGGLRVVDVSEPSAPVEVGWFDSLGNAATVAAAGRTAIVGGQFSARVEVVDLSVPSAPVRVGVLDLPRRPLGMVAHGDLFYVADGVAGLVIVDASVPSAPVIVGSLDTPGSAYGVWVEGGMAMVADGQAGVQLIGVREPGVPVLVGSVETDGAAYAVSFHDGVGVVTERNSIDVVLEVVEMSNPAEAAVVGWYRSTGLADIALIGDAAFVAGGAQAIEVVDVSDCPPCAVDVTRDGMVDTRDMLAFLNRWTAGESDADFNGDGVVDTTDLVEFLYRWVAGC